MPRFAVGALVVVLIAGCGGDIGTPATSSTTSGPVAPSTMQTTTSSAPAPTTTTAPSSSTTVTSEAPDAPMDAVLRADGLGVVSIGDPVEGSLRRLIELLGVPTTDETLEAPFGDLGSGVQACNTATGYPCHEYLRFVDWDEGGLTVLFGDWAGDEDHRRAEPNLRRYTYRGGTSEPMWATSGGISVGSSVADLRRAFGPDLWFTLDVCSIDPGFSVDHPESLGEGWLYGSLDTDDSDRWTLLPSGFVDPDSIDPDVTVASIGAGARSSC